MKYVKCDVCNNMYNDKNVIFTVAMAWENQKPICYDCNDKIWKSITAKDELDEKEED